MRNYCGENWGTFDFTLDVDLQPEELLVQLRQAERNVHLWYLVFDTKFKYGNLSLSMRQGTDVTASVDVLVLR